MQKNRTRVALRSLRVSHQACLLPLSQHFAWAMQHVRSALSHARARATAHVRFLHAAAAIVPITSAGASALVTQRRAPRRPLPGWRRLASTAACHCMPPPSSARRRQAPLPRGDDGGLARGLLPARRAVPHPCVRQQQRAVSCRQPNSLTYTHRRDSSGRFMRDSSTGSLPSAPLIPQRTWACCLATRRSSWR